MKPSDNLLADFGVNTPIFVAETSIATIWKVNYNEDFAALKIYKNANTQDEWQGFGLLKALAGQGAALVYQLGHGAALIEWLEGESLGDLSRRGCDNVATTELGRVANTIHASNARANLRTLEATFDALMTLKICAAWSHEEKSLMTTAQSLAVAHITNQIDMRALHGDLHHDNIKLTARGYVSFDAKGIIGDRAYDVANAFKNPVNAPEIYGDPRRITRLAESLGAIMDIAPKRLLGWATAHCALSIAWTSETSGDPDLNQLRKLMAAYQTTS